MQKKDFKTGKEGMNGTAKLGSGPVRCFILLCCHEHKKAGRVNQAGRNSVFGTDGQTVQCGTVQLKMETNAKVMVKTDMMK